MPSAPAAAAPLIPDGTLLAERFQVMTRVGRGGMGEVYLAFDRVTLQQVALKTVVTTEATQEVLLKALQQEVAAARRLPPHPNLLSVLELDFRHQPPFYTMEYAANGDLAVQLAKRRQLPADEVLRLVRELLSGLAVLHEAGMVHRDVKPENVLLMANGVPRLTDFGIADSLRGQLDGHGRGAGTLAYMAPEQLRGEACGPSVDLYALGLLTYQLLTGRLPFEATDAAKVRAWHMGAARHLPELPAPFAAWVARLVSPDASRRPANAGEALAMLQQRSVLPATAAAFVPVAPVVAPRASPQPPATPATVAPPAPSGRMPWVPVLLLLALLAAGGYWLMERIRDERAELSAATEDAQRRARDELAEERRRAAEERRQAAEEVEQARKRVAEELAEAQRKALADLAEAAQQKKEELAEAAPLARRDSVDAREDEEVMRQPIDALYEAWRNLDAPAYAAQWAPIGTRIDLKTGRRSTAPQVIRSRSALFPKLLSVDAEHTSRLLSVEDGVAHFYTRYTMSITSQSGRTTTEVANESYRVKKFNGRWLIIENRDYEPE